MNLFDAELDSLHHCVTYPAADRIKLISLCNKLNEFFIYLDKNQTQLFVPFGETVESLLVKDLLSYITREGDGFSWKKLFPFLGENGLYWYEGELKRKEILWLGGIKHELF